ncbi:MAG: hypothetical protein DRO63_08490 [Candidatus Gerdarchaeota archaeon]|nr:MAG: hypothetical protein DRO63_08490 [Candidatus Gerdarchaeota archaeon]RLI65101.1 MAG: hypothetical protein DRO67_03135 [Candidatus Asgardarchaeum californiense]
MITGKSRFKSFNCLLLRLLSLNFWWQYWSGTPVEPAGYCGPIAFDIPDTAQGIWVRDGWMNRWEDHGLSLVYSNTNASQGAISIGHALNSTWDSRVYLFFAERFRIYEPKFQ